MPGHGHRLAWPTSYKVREVIPLAEPPLAAPSDAELVRGHAAGDPDAFPELVRRHRDRLWAVALRTLGDREEAADALQDGLLSAYRAAGSYRGDAAVTTWLHRIVVNACLDRARRARVRRTVPLPVDELTPADPRDRISEREVSIEVVAALAGLPPEQRVALVLVDMQGFSVDEAARVLGVPVGTVKSRCARGRARLAPMLAGLGNRDPGVTVGSTAPTERAAETPGPRKENR